MPYIYRPIRPGTSISQKGFGGALGGTLGCFVQDAKTDQIMLLSNMHILQFYQAKPETSLFNVFGIGTAPPIDSLQNAIIQPCGVYLRELAEEQLVKRGNTPQKYYQATATERSRLLPTPKDVADHYKRALDSAISDLADLTEVAQFARGFLDERGDAAVATLIPGTMWMNVTPSSVTIKAPPDNYAPYTNQMVMKYGDASGKMRYGTIVDFDATIKVPFTVIHEESLLPSQGMKGDVSKNTVTMEHVWKVRSIDGKPFQIQGDSGSALLDANGRLIGLMSTGGIGPMAYAIPIERVFNNLGLKFPKATSGMAS